MFITRTNQAAAPASFFDRRAARDRRAAARDLEARLAALEEHNPMIELAADGTVLDANQHAATMLGRAPEAIRGGALLSFLGEAEPGGAEGRAFLDRVARGEAATVRLVPLAAEGGDAAVVLAASPLPPEDGGRPRAIVLLTDASAERRARRAQRALHGSPAALLVVDRGRVVTAANPAAEALLARHAEALRQAWPGFTPGRIAGTGVEGLLRDAALWQRQAADPSQPPARAVVAAGGAVLEVVVSATRDEAGQHDGFVLAWTDVTEQQLQQGQVAAMNRSQAVIEFDLDGRILHANENFLAAMGYSLEEMRGQHHSLFVDDAYRGSAEYRAFWERLGRGEFDAGQYKRIGKGGREVWIQASYNPVLDASGRAISVIKYATDITQQRLAAANAEGQLAAIDKAQAVIEFDLGGRILTANANFLNTLGYTLDEVQRPAPRPVRRAGGAARAPTTGPSGRSSAAANTTPGQYKRLGKGGREVWIQASYNPILDLNGKPFKVVKYATDITAQVQAAAAMTRAVEQVDEAWWRRPGGTTSRGGSRPRGMDGRDREPLRRRERAWSTRWRPRSR